MSEAPPVPEDHQQESTEVEPAIARGMAKVQQTDTVVALKDVLNEVAPKADVVKTPEALPVPAVITDEQRAALTKVGEVFGTVVPAERRLLEPSEVANLIEEKETLDAIKKMAEDRIKDGIRTAIFNHLDVEAEQADKVDEDTPRTKEGHYVLPGEVKAPAGAAKQFKREVSSGSPSLNPTVLKALADDPEVDWFTQQDYLAMTTQVRVVDEAKVMSVLRKKPALVKAIAKATAMGQPTASCFLRKA